jgi:predicted O-methyltransferase YrrM
MRVPTHLRDGEKVALYRQVLKLPRNCVALEVGSYLGASACVIGSAIVRRSGVLHCVDTWKNQAMDAPERDTWLEFQANTDAVREILVPHRGFSTDVARDLQVVLDFLFIDGDHSEEAVDADLSAWLPKVKPGGIVAMHDIGWAEGVVKGYQKHLRGRVSSEQRLPRGEEWQNLLICKFLG